MLFKFNRAFEAHNYKKGKNTYFNPSFNLNTQYVLTRIIGLIFFTDFMIVLLTYQQFQLNYFIIYF